jgi:hypothetical protein
MFPTSWALILCFYSLEMRRYMLDYYYYFNTKEWRICYLYLDYFTDTMAKVLWVFLYRTYTLNFFKLFFSFVLWLVTWITIGPSCRYLLYAYKLTICSFVCMGTGEAGPSSLLWQDESGKFYCHTHVAFYPICWTLQIELHVILVFGCIMVLNYKFYHLNLGMFCKLPTWAHKLSWLVWIVSCLQATSTSSQAWLSSIDYGLCASYQHELTSLVD